MNTIKFSVDGSSQIWVGATDGSLSLETKGFLWGLLATRVGSVEVSEYAPLLQELIDSGYLLLKEKADAVIVPSPFSKLQADVFFCSDHPLNWTGKRKKARPLGERFFPVFMERYNDLRAPAWAKCETQTAARVRSLSAYLKECKRRSQGEFLDYGLNTFERGLKYAAGDAWWQAKRHNISVFLKISADHPFDLRNPWFPGCHGPGLCAARR